MMNQTPSHTASAAVDPTIAPATLEKDVEQTKDPFLVEWNGPDDPENPQNFNRGRKWMMTMSLSLMTLWVTFASSVFSEATAATAKEFHVKTEVMTLGTSLPIFGFAISPLVWGPLSELYGRKYPLFIGYAAFVVFQIPVAVAQTAQIVLIGRFFVGFFGCAPLAIVGGAMADIWDPVDRGVTIAFFSAATFGGPTFGPIIGGFIVDSHLGWRWTAWITMIAAGAFGLASFFIVPESYPPVLLQRRAARLRQESQNWALHAKLDMSRPTWQEFLLKFLLRPILMLFLEPILLCITIYLSLIYGILYLFFESYPMMIAAVLLPGGLFWFGWTSDPSVSWVARVFAGIPIGCGIFVIFMQGLNYLIDVYLVYANSAMAANTMVRCAFGGAFPLFAAQMFHKLGVTWAASLLGFLTLAMVPVPFLFYFYGKKIRSFSGFSFS